jgi:hypothetical protein
MIWQRGTTIDASTTAGIDQVNDNASYCADRWMLLSGNSSSTKNDLVDVTRNVSAPPAGVWSNLRMTVQAGVVAQDFSGIFQILEGRDSAQFALSSSISISAHLKASSGITGARIMVLGWTGAEDSLGASSDPISDWQSAGDPTGPTFKVNWTKLIDSTQITATTGWVRTEVEDTDISGTAGVKNIGILIYIDDALYGAGDTLEVSGVQLENGASSSAFVHRNPTTELQRCERYYTNTFDEGVNPKNQIGADTGVLMPSLSWATAGDDNFGYSHAFPTKMISTPTVTVYNPVNDTDASFYDQRDAADVLVSSVAETISESRVNWSIENNERSRILSGHVAADAEF